MGSIPGLRRSPGVGTGNPLQYSCPENQHGQRSLWIQYMGSQRVGHARVTYTHTDVPSSYHSWQNISKCFSFHSPEILYESQIEVHWSYLYTFIFVGLRHHLEVQKSRKLMQENWVPFLGWEDPLEKGMATHSSNLDWRIPRTKEPGRLQPRVLQRVGYDRATNAFIFFNI